MLRAAFFSLNCVIQPLNNKNLFVRLHTFAKFCMSHLSREHRNSILKRLYVFLVLWSVLDWKTMGIQSRSFHFLIRIATFHIQLLLQQ